MGRKKGYKQALTGAERTRIYRERRKLQQHQNNTIDKYLKQNNQRKSVQIDESVASTSSAVTPVNEQLREWANTHRISKRALNQLLPILKSNGMSSLPLNYRTLQETPTNIEIPNVAGGQLWYNGLGNCLKKVFATLSQDCTIYLNFNIDGLPLYNSSKATFWPILASIAGLYFKLQLFFFNCNSVHIFLIIFRETRNQTNGCISLVR